MAIGHIETAASVVLQVALPPLQQVVIEMRGPGAREALQAAVRSGRLRR